MKVKIITKNYPVISGIYKLNYPNGKCYIGQSKNIYKRVIQHNNYAKYEHGSHNLQACELAIQKYGFLKEFEILEQILDEKKLDERETYWIKYYNSGIKENGYNIVLQGNASKKSGVNNKNAVFTEETLKEVIDLLINHREMSMIEIAQKFNVDHNTIIRINTGKSYVNNQLNYPLRKDSKKVPLKKFNDYFQNEQKLIQLKEDLLYRWDLSIESDLQKKYNLPIAILRDINNGRRYQNIGNYSYPIRNKNIRNNNNLTIQKVKQIIEKLKTKESIVNISKETGLSRNTIYNINSGKSYIIKNQQYPIRKLNK